MPQKILLPIDGSGPALAAARWVISFSQCQGAQVYGPVVIDPYLYAGVGQAWTSRQHTHSQGAAAPAKQHLVVSRSDGEALQVPFHSTMLESASVVKRILQAQQSLGRDLIALGSHGCGGVPAPLLGSVAQEVLAQSTVPVMILKA